MDYVDRKILRALQNDARMSHQELADRVGLSPSPCARRIRKMQRDGVIAGYGAKIDEAKMGFGFSVFVSVRLDKQVDSRLQDFEKNIRGLLEVVDCWLMTGKSDYLLRVAVTDLTEFERFLTGKLTKIAGIASIKSSIPIRRVKDGQSRLD
jgi:Lrp/AsnC family transcriptional regulator, leucine-responsive regulatory protein